MALALRACRSWSGVRAGGDAERVGWVRIEQQLAHSLDLRGLADQLGGAQQLIERQQRRAVRLMRPEHQARAAPAVAAQPIERAVVAGPGEGVRFDVLALGTGRFGEVGPAADE